MSPYEFEEFLHKRRAYNRQYSRELRAWRKAHNLCVMCGKFKPIKNRVQCQNCLDLHSVYGYRHRARVNTEGRQLQFDFKEWLTVG